MIPFELDGDKKFSEHSKEWAEPMIEQLEHMDADELEDWKNNFDVQNYIKYNINNYWQNELSYVWEWQYLQLRDGNCYDYSAQKQKSMESKKKRPRPN